MALELVHGKPGEKAFEVVDLCHSGWKQLVELAMRFDWDPKSIPSDAPKDASLCNFSSWYFWDQPAQVTSAQATAWADALDRALETPELKNATLPKFLKDAEQGVEVALSDPNYARFNGLSREMVEQFVRFLRRGEFIYAVWD